MKYDKTVCEKVNEIEDELKIAAKTKNFDIIRVSRLLKEIRFSAQRMENGLVKRKKIMVENDLEATYQKSKGNDKPEGINKIAGAEERAIQRQAFEVVIKREGEVVYAHTAYAGAISLVEKVQDIDKYGTITGICQVLTFGHPLGYWFAFNQLEHNVRDKNIEILTSIQSLMKNDKMDRSSRELVMNALGKMNYGK